MRTRLTIDVVVVFPCVPAMPMPYFRRMTSASISARRMTGMFRLRASSTSGLSLPTAEEYTRASTSGARFAALCPIITLIPSDWSRSVLSLAARSEPVTANPSALRISAIPLMPMPPMPTK